MKFCDCGTTKWGLLNRKDGLILCGDCGLPIECDFSYMSHPHPATDTHIDYIVCGEHMDAAADNVSSMR